MTKLNFEGIRNSAKFSRFKSRYLPLYLMLVPFLLYYIIFKYKPLTGLVIAFQDYNIFRGIEGSEWVGLKHFINFFKTPTVGRLFRNTLMLNFLNILFTFPAPIIFALLLNEVKSKTLKKSVQTLTYIPHFISSVVAAGIVINMLAPGYGIITKLVEAITGKSYFFAVMPAAFRPTYIGMHLWKGLGWSSIVYMSALSSIDTQLYEAAAIDGANKLRRIWHITLPGIMPTISTLLIMRIGSLLESGTETILLLQQPATYEVSDVIGTYVYRAGLTDGNYSFSTAISLFNSFFDIIFVIIANMLSKKLTEVGLW